MVAECVLGLYQLLLECLSFACQYLFDALPVTSYVKVRITNRANDSGNWRVTEKDKYDGPTKASLLFFTVQNIAQCMYLSTDLKSSGLK
jgi:hypothetical protein